MKIKTINHTQKPQIVVIDSIESLFGPKDQYPIPTTSMINTKAFGQFDSENKKQSNEAAEQAIGTLPSHTTEASVLAVKIKENQQIKLDLMYVSLEN